MKIINRSILCLVLLLPWYLYAQAQQVTGKVINGSDSTAISGASVKIAGSQRGVITNDLGFFTINATTGDTLEISAIGFETEKSPAFTNGSLILTINLTPKVEGLNDVTVIGFNQTVRNIAQTGAVSTVTTKELVQSPVANLSNALAGRLPGLTAIQRSGEPGFSGATLLIRGLATLNSSTPLVTIDGIPKTIDDIDRLDPNEVASFSILKDASATALYGVKGANGVIIITTRRGKIGKAQMSISLEKAVQSATRLPKYLDAYDYATLMNEAYKNDNPDGTQIPYSDEALQAYKTGSDPYKYPDVNWLDEILKPAAQTRADFNITGGNQMVRYFVNAGYVSQDGLYKTVKNSDYDPNTNYKRYNFRSNVDIDFDKNFSVGLSLAGAIENEHYPNVSAASLFSTLTRDPFNAMPVQYPIGFYGGSTLYNNPFVQLNESGYIENFNSALTGNFSANYKLDFITQGLSLKGQYSFDGYYTNSYTRTKSVRTAVYNGSGDLSDTSSYSFIGQDSPLSAPSNTFNQDRHTWLALSVNYDRKFGKHELTGLLLANRTQDILQGSIPYVSQGLVSRITYDYDDKYFAEFNAGYNGTDQFAPGKRYGFFPAISAGWVLSREKWVAGHLGFFDLLKLRASYGLTGNDQLNSGRRWLYVSEWNAGGGYSYGDPLTGVGGYTEGALANPDVTWEKAHKLNIGLDIKALHDKLGITLDVFHEKRNDILITRSSIPALIGVPAANLPPVNFGEVVNRGFEAQVNYDGHINSDLRYFIKINGSYARNKILFMDEEHRQYDYLYRTGKPIGQLYGYTAIGYFKDQADIDASPTQFGKLIPGDLKYKDLNGDGVIDANDMGPIGSTTTPEIMYGISGGLSYKGFDFSFLFQGAADYDVQLSDEAAYEFFNGGNVMQIHLGRWTPATAATAIYPVLHDGANANTDQPSTFFTRDASYIRLKNAEIGYSLSRHLLSHIGLKGVRIYINGQNLLTFDKLHKYFSFDPEAPSGRGAFYPQLKVFNAGISVNL